MSRAPRSPRIDLSGVPPAAPSAAGWQRHKPREAREPGDAPAPAPVVPAAPVLLRGVVLEAGAVPTADVVAERASPLLPSSGRAGAAGDGAPPGPEPVRLLAPTAASPFAPGREVAFARVEGDLLARLGVRNGDHVALWRCDTAEPGDLAAVLDATGRAGLWRVYPERDELRLTTGDPACARRSGRRPRVQGVVVAVHRSFAARPVQARSPDARTASPRRPAAVSTAVHGR